MIVLNDKSKLAEIVKSLHMIMVIIPKKEGDIEKLRRALVWTGDIVTSVSMKGREGFMVTAIASSFIEPELLDLYELGELYDSDMYLDPSFEDMTFLEHEYMDDCVYKHNDDTQYLESCQAAYRELTSIIDGKEKQKLN